jgi:hypothetical protein
MSILTAETTHTAPNTTPLTSWTDSDDIETQSTREGSIVTDDSVRY